MEKVTIISSQRFLDDEIVATKKENQDYEVCVSPVFEFEGNLYQVVLDGHHSHQAAIEAGVDPIYMEADSTTDDRISLLDGNIDDFLYLCHGGDDWYDIITGHDIW